MSLQPQDDKVDRFRLTSPDLIKYNKSVTDSNNKKKIRIMTFNVHSYENYDGVRTERQIRDLITSLNVDILCLQESRGNMLEDMYPYSIKCVTEGTLRNVVLSRYPICSSEEIPIANNRCAIKATIRLKNKMLDVVNVHLPLYGSGRQISMIKILQRISSVNSVIVGDFNSYKRSSYTPVQMQRLAELKTGRGYPNIFETTDILENNRCPFIDSFTLEALQKRAPVKHPVNTTVYGGTVDYVYLCRHANFIISGSYVYHTDVSDHLPVICDILDNK